MEDKNASSLTHLKHVTRHLQEVSLAVLPQIGGQETDSSGSNSTDEVLGEAGGNDVSIDETASERLDGSSKMASWAEYDDGEEGGAPQYLTQGEREHVNTFMCLVTKGPREKARM